MNYLDLLARLGEGSVHPGGFRSTLRLLDKHPIAPGSRVLEVGCGAGRTACHLARTGCLVTAVDNSPDMLDKARRRAMQEQVDIRFQQADVLALPFPPDSFDVVFVESVTVFTDTEPALREYYRVLRKGGTLYDREIVLIGKAPESIHRKFSDFYGIKRMLPPERWIGLMKACRYAEPKVWGLKRTIPFVTDVDQNRELDPTAFFDPEVLKTVQMNFRLITRYKNNLGYAVFIGKK